MKIFCDGSGFNGEHSKFSVLFKDGNLTRSYIMRIPDRQTNNMMEYMAVLTACAFADNETEILTDSQLVVNQVAGAYKCKDRMLFGICSAVRELVTIKGLKLKWIPREQNEADKLI